MRTLVMVKAGLSTDLLEMKDNSYQISLVEMQPCQQVQSPEGDVLAVAQTDWIEVEMDEILNRQAKYAHGSDDDDGYPSDG